MEKPNAIFRGSRYLVEICYDALVAMAYESSEAFRKGLETGGVLFCNETVGRGIMITEAYPAPSDSQAGPNHFLRGTAGLAELFTQKHEIGQFYAGEWHSHPSGGLKASVQDFQTMRAMHERADYVPSALVLVLVGISQTKRPEFAVTIITRDGFEELGRTQ